MSIVLTYFTKILESQRLFKWISLTESYIIFSEQLLNVSIAIKPLIFIIEKIQGHIKKLFSKRLARLSINYIKKLKLD